MGFALDTRIRKISEKDVELAVELAGCIVEA